MTLHELIHRHGFDAIIPNLVAIDPGNISGNLYVFREAFDELRRMTPGNAEGKQIVITTEVDTDKNGNEVDINDVIYNNWFDNFFYVLFIKQLF